MLKYISISRNTKDDTSLLANNGVVVSLRDSSRPDITEFPLCPLKDFAPSFFSDAPYPASSTAFIISCAIAVPSTPIEFVRRLTEQLVTPSTFATAFSTLAWQAAHVIPVTLYCCIFIILSDFLPNL